MITVENGALNIDVEALKTTLAEEGGAEKVTEALKDVKAYTNTQFTSMMNNYAKDTRERYKDEAYAEHKRDILGSAEKKLKEKFGLSDLEGGKDYKTTEDLIGIILDKNKATSGDTDKEKEEMQAKLREFSEKMEGMIPKGELTKLQNRIFEQALDNEISKYSDRIEIEPEKVHGQLEFLKYQFDKKGYKVSEKDGQQVILNKDGEVLKDETYQPKTLSQVVSTLASEVLTLKQGHAGGRGGNNGKPGDTSPLAAFESIQELNQHMQGKGIDPLGKEGIRMAAEWKKATGK